MDCWKNTEIQNLIKNMAVYFSDLDDYGKGVDLNAILEKYKLYLQGKFTVEQVIYSLHVHCERKRIIPKVPDLLDILDPVKPKITQSEYISALDYQKRNNYPIYSAEAILIREYTAQQDEDRGAKNDGPVHPQLAARAEAEIERIEKEVKSSEQP